jgi:hypothetical protein
MSNQEITTGLYTRPACTRSQQTQTPLQEHKEPEKPGRATAPKGIASPIASQADHLAFAHPFSDAASSADVLGRRFQHQDTKMQNTSFSIQSEEPADIAECPGVSYSVLPRGRTLTISKWKGSASLQGVSWASCPQPRYKRASTRVRPCTPTIVESAGRTPGTPICIPVLSGRRNADSGKRVSSPGGGHYRTPQDTLCPGRPTPNSEIFGVVSL